MTTPMIAFEHVSKRYRMGQLGAKSLREELTHSVRKLVSRHAGRDSTADEFYALRDVTLHVGPGETVGVIGPNGSGKSTILKLLAHIIFATHGRIVADGSVASLIEVGAGFHPELTGRENIYLYGSMMGMHREEVRARFEQIVDFAGIEEFLDVPLKRYSSGMYIRLGFSVAAHINPDILLLDEVLAVGDAAFQKKCLERVQALRRAGMTIVFVSHDMLAIERLCDRVYFLQQGCLRSEGEPRQVIREYYETVVATTGLAPTAKGSLSVETSAGQCAEIHSVQFVGADGRPSDAFATGQPIVARIEYSAPRGVPDAEFDLSFLSPDGRLYCQFSTRSRETSTAPLPERGVVEMTCDELGLTPGVYVVEASITRNGGVEVYDRRPLCASLRVLPGKPARGMFYAPHRCRVVPLATGLEVR